MPRPLGTESVKGLHVTRKTDGDGQPVEYFRNRYIGQNLGTDRSIAEARMREWHAAQVPSRPAGKASLDA